MSHAFLKEVLQEYDVIRRQEAKSLNLRRQEVIERIPEILDLQRDIIGLMAQRSREIIRQPKEASETLSELQNRISQLKHRELEIMAEHGFPPDYLKIRYRCPRCEDTGYVGYPVRERCKCLSQKLLTKAYELSDIHELEVENFDTFDPNVFPEFTPENSRITQREYMVQLRDRLMEYSFTFPKNDKRSILFTGKTGLGKTFLLNCMAKSIMDRGYTVIRISAYKLFDQLFFSALSDNSGNAALHRHLFEADALIIDDLGTETRRNNYTSEDLFNILNERTLKRSHTFLSTNLGLSDLRNRYSDRITSRLFDTSNTMIIRFRGQDIRLR